MNWGSRLWKSNPQILAGMIRCDARDYPAIMTALTAYALVRDSARRGAIVLS